MTTTYSIDLTDPDRPIRSGHLKLGGVNPEGRRLEVTNAYLALDGRPFFGVSGEFQFSRYPEADWEEELLKMKAGGINVVATYVFWIHHEGNPGRFDWSGRNNLRRFIQLCEKHDLWVVTRVGPFCHGECRNGGMPDWLYGQPFEVRSNDPEYLAFVERYFRQIGAQLNGLFFKDGGPIIGLQLENEFGHTGAPWDAADRSQPIEWMSRSSGGVDHILRLREMAAEAGLVAPLLTFTAWGSPIIEGESLPVHGGYAYPVWIDQPGPSSMYRFSDLTSNPPDEHSLLYSTDGVYPSIMAEMQGGIQVRYNNRPEVPPRSTEAFTLVTAGSGCNFIGYYIYHGGSNPVGSRGYTNEILHPQVSYDFQAPIGEFGEVRDAARYVKLLHYFFHTFGETLSPMQVRLPPGAAEIQPEDDRSLRWSVRSRGKAGFVFLNNFQDHLEMQPHANFSLELNLPDQSIRFPSSGDLTLPPDAACIFPFNLDLDGLRLESATAQPLTMLRRVGETHYFFFAPEDIPPQYVFETAALQSIRGDFTQVQDGSRSVIHVEPGAERSFNLLAPDGSMVRITTLTRREAEHAWLGTAWGEQRLVISNADPLFIDGGVDLRITGSPKVEAIVFPALQRPIAASVSRFSRRDFDHYTNFSLSTTPHSPPFTLTPRGNGKYYMEFTPETFAGVHDVFMKIDYTADTGAAFINGELVADHYNNGTPWIVGLKRFIPGLLAHGMTMKFRPLRKGVVKNTSSAMAARLAFEGEEVLRVDGIQLLSEYALRLFA